SSAGGVVVPASPSARIVASRTLASALPAVSPPARSITLPSAAVGASILGGDVSGTPPLASPGEPLVSVDTLVSADTLASTDEPGASGLVTLASLRDPTLPASLPHAAKTMLTRAPPHVLARSAPR